MQMFFRVEGEGKSVVGLIRAVSLNHGISKLTALYTHDLGWTSHEVSTKISDHSQELMEAGYARTN